MKREKDIIYQILKWAEENATGMAKAVDLEIDPDKLHYHIRLCKEAGFLRPQTVIGSGMNQYQVKDLTWAGHNALDKLKDGCDMRAICG